MAAVRLDDLARSLRSYLEVRPEDPLEIRQLSARTIEQNYPEAERLGLLFGARCDWNADERLSRWEGMADCAQYFAQKASDAMLSADPAGFAVWQLQASLEQLPTAGTIGQIATIAGRHGLSCRAAVDLCREALTRQLETQLRDAESLSVISDALDAGADPRVPYAGRRRQQIVEEMSQIGCFDEEEASPVQVARVAPRDFGPASAIPAPQRQVPVGGPVLEMDPARDPTPTPADNVWVTVQPGNMAYRGNGIYGAYTWDELPQSIGPEGALITLTVTGSTSNTGGWATGIQIRGNARITNPDGSPIDLDVPLNLAPGASGQQARTFLITPNDGSVGQDVEILVGAFYGAQVRYHYKVVRSAGS